MASNEKERRGEKLYLLVVLLMSTLIILNVAGETEAQFFTKSLKSIPRMGRRSDSMEGEVSMIAPSQSYHHFLIDNLIDVYGPKLLENLINQQQRAVSSQMDEQSEQQGEISYIDEQPQDQLGSVNLKESAYDALHSPMSRNERSGNPLKDTSLAMRALNINRYMQHLDSGQPLMSYDKLFKGAQRSREPFITENKQLGMTTLTDQKEQ